MKYHVLEDGEWVKLEPRRGNKLGCCDCGLIHVFNYKVRDGKIYRQLIRDKRATGQTRRRMKRLGQGLWGRLGLDEKKKE